jgi:hypothetical protein
MAKQFLPTSVSAGGASAFCGRFTASTWQDVTMSPTRRQRDDEEPDRLVIDRAAAAETLSDDDVRSWAREQRVFISSVMGELRNERRAVAEAISELGAEPVWFEDFGGRDADPENAYIGELSSSTIYVGILGSHYGRLLPTRFSATHTEYNYAEAHGVRVCVYPLDVPDRDGRAESFLNEVWQFHTAPVVRASDLPTSVTKRLRRIAAEELSPWCKLGDAVFRTTAVEEGKDEILVTARVRSRDVMHSLDEKRNDDWRTFQGLFTYDDRCYQVGVAGIETATTGSASRTFRIRLEVQEPKYDSLLQVSSFNGKSHSELTALALKEVLFGEEDHFAEQHRGFLPDFPDPLVPLRGQNLSDETIRPLVRLLLAEALVGSGRVKRLVKFRLGAAVAGRRRLELGWEGRRQYSNQPPERGEVSGVVDLP